MARKECLTGEGRKEYLARTEFLTSKEPAARGRTRLDRRGELMRERMGIRLLGKAISSTL